MNKFCKDCVYFVKDDSFSDTNTSRELHARCGYPSVLNLVSGRADSVCWFQRYGYAWLGQNKCGSQGSWWEEKKVLNIIDGTNYYPRSV